MDLAAELENNFLAFIRTSSVFFVGAIALFNFTSSGKSFSLISIIIAIILLTAVTVDYFVERSKIAALGFFPRTIIDILAFALIGVLLLLWWIFYSIWTTPETSLGDLAREVEKEVQSANTELIKNVKDVEEKIIITNKNLIEAIRNINNPNYVPSQIPIAAPSITETSKVASKIIKSEADLAGLAISEAGRSRQSNINKAVIAAIPTI